MKQLLKATFYRMSKSMGVRIAMGLIWIAAICYYVLAGMLANGQFDATQAGSITAFGDAMILWLFGSLIIGFLVGNDFENKTIHGAIKFGRKRIVQNYMLTFALLVLVMVLPYTIGSIACIASGADFTGAEGTIISIYMGNVFEYTQKTSVAKLVLSYITYAVVYIGQLSICVPVAVKMKKTVVVTAFGFFFGMITALIATLASKVDLLDNIYRLTPYHYGIGKIGVNADVTDMITGIIVSMCFTAIMGLVSWLIFKKSDIK